MKVSTRVVVVTYGQWAPHASVSGIIDCWWMLEGSGEGQPHAVLPDGCVEIIVHIGDPMERLSADGLYERQERVLVAGQMSRALTLRPAGCVATVGVRLRPAASRTLLGVPAHELTDRIEALVSVNPALARLVVPTTLDGSARQCAGELDRRLTAALQGRRPDPTSAQAVATIERTGGGASIHRLCAATGVSARELERRFKRDVGLSPKRFSRIVRFQRAVTAIVDGERRLVDAALSGGYYDQSHFIREFKAFAAVPPQEWFARSAGLADYFTAAWRERARTISE